jgi:hypothetical protein
VDEHVGVSLNLINEEFKICNYTMGPKENAIYSVQHGTHLSKYPNFINDKDVVLAAVKYNTYNVLSASDDLQKDEDVALAVVNKDGFH